MKESHVSETLEDKDNGTKCSQCGMRVYNTACTCMLFTTLCMLVRMYVHQQTTLVQ
mgnify:FL=1